MAGWLAGLDAFVVGLAYLGALLASRFVVRPLLLSLFGSAPVVGGWLRSQVDSNLAQFERTITPAANASMGTLISALDWLTSQGRGVLNGVSSLADATYSALYHLGAETIGHAVGVSERWVESLVEAARGYALGLFRQAEYDAKSFLGQAEADAVALTSAVRSEARSEVQAAERVVLDEIRKAEQATGELFTKAEYDAQQFGQRAEAVAAQLVAGAELLFGTALNTIQKDLNAIEDQALAQIPEALRNLNKDLEAISAQVEAQPEEARRNLDKEITELKSSAPWLLITDLVKEGEGLVGTAIIDLVQVEQKALRAEIAGAKALQSTLGPFVRSITAQVRGK